MPMNRRQKARDMAPRWNANDFDELEDYAALCKRLTFAPPTPEFAIGQRVRLTAGVMMRNDMPESLREGYVIERRNGGCLVQHNGAQFGWMEYELERVE
jgi:hypothetical protein